MELLGQSGRKLLLMGFEQLYDDGYSRLLLGLRNGDKRARSWLRGRPRNLKRPEVDTHRP